MAKKAIKSKKRGLAPLTEQPRSFMDYVTGTSRLSRTPAQPKQNALSKASANFKGLMKQLPNANPFEFDDTVANAAKNLPGNNRKMKKRSVKDKEMAVKSAPKGDASMRKHRAIKKRNSFLKNAITRPENLGEGVYANSDADPESTPMLNGKKRSVKKSGSFKGKSNKLGFGGRAAQMKAQGVPGGVIGAIARKEGAAPGGPNYHGSKKRVISKKRSVTKKRGIGNAVAKATGWPRGLNSVNLNKSGTIGTEPISKGNNKYTEIKAGSLGKLDIPMGTLKRKKSSMPQRKTNKSMTGMQLLRKATAHRR